MFEYNGIVYVSYESYESSVLMVIINVYTINITCTFNKSYLQSVPQYRIPKVNI